MPQNPSVRGIVSLIERFPQNGVILEFYEGEEKFATIAESKFTINDLEIFCAQFNKVNRHFPEIDYAGELINEFIDRGYDINARISASSRKCLVSKDGNIKYLDQDTIGFIPALGKHYTKDAPKNVTFDINYYREKSLDNLTKSSRTALGIIDVSASADKQTYMSAQSGNETAALAVQNYTRAIESLYKNRYKKFENAGELREFVEKISKDINNGIVSENVLLREHDSDKYPYVKSSEIEKDMNDFYSVLLKKIDDPNSDPREVSAYVEYGINLSGHYFADGCGKSSSALSAFVCMRYDAPLINYPGKKEFFAHAPKNTREGGQDILQDPEFHAFKDFYVRQFSQESDVNLAQLHQITSGMEQLSRV